jgi:hypothetical protein
MALSFLLFFEMFVPMTAPFTSGRGHGYES